MKCENLSCRLWKKKESTKWKMMRFQLHTWPKQNVKPLTVKSSEKTTLTSIIYTPRLVKSRQAFVSKLSKRRNEMEKELFELNAKLQQKKNALRKQLKEMGVQPRDKENTFDKYRYFSEAGYKKLFTELFSENGLELTPTTKEVTTYTVEGKQPNGRLVRVSFRLSDMETGFYEDIEIVGEGIDKGDKGIYKAYTGALKYFLADTFMVATGDDPEEESPEGKMQKKTGFVNEEIAMNQYRSFIDRYFAKRPEMELAFLEKYNIKTIDEIDKKVNLSVIDNIISKMKADIKAQEGEETF